jgi:DNA-binding response OmpR family regulator
VLDQSLSDCSGRDVCVRLKSMPALQHVPVIFLTGLPISSGDCLRSGAMCHVTKGDDAETEFGAALDAVLLQQERARGVIDAGDLRLDPATGEVRLAGGSRALLPPNLFLLFRELVLAAPRAVPYGRLYELLLQRRRYRKQDPELTERRGVRNAICALRKRLDSECKVRIEHVAGGYAYRAPCATQGL